MKFFPVRVPRDPYRGKQLRCLRKQAEHNRVAQRIEEYLNRELVKEPDNAVNSYHSYEIADDLREDAELVRNIVFGIDGGWHGVTICKGNLDEAMRRKS